MTLPGTYSDPSIRIQKLCQQMQAGWVELAGLENDVVDSQPGAPASPEDIARLREAFPALPDHYLMFLKFHDGWRRHFYGEMLFSAAEALGSGRNCAEEFLEIQAESGHDLGEIIAIGNSENDGRILFVDPANGTVVEYFYEENARHATFADFLESRLDLLRGVIEETRARLLLLEQGKGAAYREANERRVITRAVERLHATETPQSAAADLDCVPAYIRRTRWTSETLLQPTDAAHVQLALSLYLAYNPTSQEMREALRAWRRHFPWSGKAALSPFNYCPFSTNLDNPGDETAWEPFLSDTSDREFFGFSWSESESEFSEEAPGCRTFSIRVFPTVDGQPSASLCLATLPQDADPKPLIGLAQELNRILPVRSGLAGFQARWSEPKGMKPCYDWCRRFHGLDLQDSNHIYPALREGVRGANWLTILGRGLTRAYEEAQGGLAFDEAAIEVLQDDAGMVIRAGSRPMLGDVARGEPPTLYAAVERSLLPLKIGTADDAQRLHVFTHFQIDEERYGPWLYRLIEPDRFLTHSAWELSQLLEEVAKQGSPEEIDDLLAHLCAATPESNTGRLAYNAGCYAGQRDLQSQARSLYEYSLSCPDPIPQVIANLLPTYIKLGEIDRACEFADACLHRARELPVIYFNAACAFGERGDAERALELTRRAIEEGCRKFEAMKTDSSLALLADDPRFQALFADIE